MKKTFFILFLFCLFAQCSSDTRDSAKLDTTQKANKSANASTTILLVGHDLDSQPETHGYIPNLSDLSTCIKSMPGMKAYVVNGWPSPQLLDMADALVLYGSPGAEICLHADRAEGFKKALGRGMGLMAIHWSTAVNARNEATLGADWMEALGGYWVHHSGVELVETKVVQVDKSHPICSGWPNMPLNDEYYLKPKIGPNAKVLLKAEVNNRALDVAWYTERSDGGRSFATTLGHFDSSFDDIAFRRFILNSIFWTAKKEVPSGGVACK